MQNDLDTSFDGHYKMLTSFNICSVLIWLAHLSIPMQLKRANELSVILPDLVSGFGPVPRLLRENPDHDERDGPRHRRRASHRRRQLRPTRRRQRQGRLRDVSPSNRSHRKIWKGQWNNFWESLFQIVFSIPLDLEVHFLIWGLSEVKDLFRYVVKTKWFVGFIALKFARLVLNLLLNYFQFRSISRQIHFDLTFILEVRFEPMKSG